MVLPRLAVSSNMLTLDDLRPLNFLKQVLAHRDHLLDHWGLLGLAVDLIDDFLSILGVQGVVHLPEVLPRGRVPELVVVREVLLEAGHSGQSSFVFVVDVVVLILGDIHILELLHTE